MSDEQRDRYVKDLEAQVEAIYRRVGAASTTSSPSGGW